MKIEKCPFCGGEAAVCDIKKPSVNGWIGCQRCRCFMDFVNNGKPQAIAAWNRRAGKDINVATNNAVPVVRGEWERMTNPYGELEGFMCACGRTSQSADNYCPNCGAKMEIEL